MKKTLLFSLAMGLVITGCEKGLDNAVNDETVGTTVNFTSSIIKSRATDTSWEAGDEIGVYMQNADDATAFLNINVKYLNSSENINGFTSETPIAYPGGEVSFVNFMAVYPYNENITDGSYLFTLGNNLSDNDIMYASSPLIEAGTANVELTFKHKLSKIVLNVKDENGDPVTGATTVSIDKQCVNGSLNMADGNVVAHGTPSYDASVNFADKGNGVYETIVLPDEAREGRIILIKTADGVVYRCPINNVEFESSKRYTFPVVLYSKEPSVGQPELVPNIDDWTDGLSTGWVVAPDVNITTSKTQYTLLEEQNLTTGTSVSISDFSGTLKATDAYCIEYSRTDATTDAKLTINNKTNSNTPKEFVLPAGMPRGKVIFAVGQFVDGISISSDSDITLNSVSVYSENQITVVVPIVVWSGEHNLGDWNGTNIEYTADVLTKTTVGSTLRFFYKDKTDGAQLQFAGQETIDVSDNSGNVDMSVTEGLITALSENSWPWMSGKNMTITKIVLIPAASSDGE